MPVRRAVRALCDTVWVTTPIIQDLDGVKRKPSLALALLVFIGYLAIIIGANRIFASDFDFGDVVTSAAHTRDGVFLPVLFASIYLIVVTGALGWWRPALREPRRRVQLPTWLWAIPLLALLGPALDIWRSDYRSEFTTSHWVWIIAGFALVGYSEELMTRGLLLVGARNAMNELWAALFTSLMFGLMHGLNILFGQDASTTIKQVIATIPMGLIFYVCRRVSGTLVTAMALHALYDIGLVVFGGPNTALNQLDTELKQPIGALFAMLLALVALFVCRTKLFKSIDDLSPAA